MGAGGVSEDRVRGIIRRRVAIECPPVRAECLPSASPTATGARLSPAHITLRTAPQRSAQHSDWSVRLNLKPDCRRRPANALLPCGHCTVYERSVWR